MSRTDIIADSLTIIRNAARTKKDEFIIPYSKIMAKVCDILKGEGYLEDFKQIEFGKVKQIKGYLRYEKKKSIITEIRRISTPGRRVYVNRKAISSVLRGHGIGIVTTSQGLLTDKQAREKGLGGEYIAQAW